VSAENAISANPPQPEEEISLLIRAIEFYFHPGDRSEIYHGRHPVPSKPVRISSRRFFAIYEQEEGYRTVFRAEGSEIDYSNNRRLLNYCESIGMNVASEESGYPVLVANLDIGPEQEMEIAIMTQFGQGSGESYKYSRTSSGISVAHSGCLTY